MKSAFVSEMVLELSIQKAEQEFLDATSPLTEEIKQRLKQLEEEDKKGSLKELRGRGIFPYVQ